MTEEHFEPASEQLTIDSLVERHAAVIGTVESAQEFADKVIEALQQESEANFKLLLAAFNSYAKSMSGVRYAEYAKPLMGGSLLEYPTWRRQRAERRTTAQTTISALVEEVNKELIGCRIKIDFVAAPENDDS